MDDWQTQMKINDLESKVNSLSSSQSSYSGPALEGAELRKQVMSLVFLLGPPIVIGIVVGWDWSIVYMIFAIFYLTVVRWFVDFVRRFFK